MNQKALYVYALRIAWQDYYNLSKEQVLDRKIISRHKRVIHKLQDKLRKPLTDFIPFEAFGLWFYKLNPEIFKEDMIMYWWKRL
jgi:hypothetical protein